MGFGTLLRSVRAWRGTSQIKLAGKIGVVQQVISRIEHEIVLPTPELAERIKQALDWDKALREMQETPDQVIVQRGEDRG